MAKRMEEIRKDGSVKRSFSGIKWIVLLVIAVFLVTSAFTIVPAGNTGVVLTLGKVSSTSFSEGFHLKIPFIQQVEPMSNKIQVYETPASAVSKDLQTVSSNIAVNYRLISDKSPDMYKNVGADYQTILIAPVVQECMKSATAKYTAEQLITERQAVGDEVKSALDTKLNSYGIYIEKFNIVNFDFSDEFNNAIEAKQVAEQNLLKTQTEQEQAIVIAEANAKQKVIAANAEAEAILAQAQAQADANRLLEESLSDKVIAYEQIEKWDGVMPKVTSGGNGMLIDIDLDSLGSSGSSTYDYSSYSSPAVTQDAGAESGNE
ncbi:MAG: prohibitin family protein [Ruminococcus sp.]|nr:prohibitin family protein [Ruminococcus sp.]